MGNYCVVEESKYIFKRYAIVLCRILVKVREAVGINSYKKCGITVWLYCLKYVYLQPKCNYGFLFKMIRRAVGIDCYKKKLNYCEVAEYERYFQ